MNNGHELAFPLIEQAEHPNSVNFGLTKREYFAALAMQGLLAKSGFSCAHDSKHQELTEEAVRFADALLAELEK